MLKKSIHPFSPDHLQVLQGVFPDLVLYGSLQRSLVLTIGRHPVHVPVPDRIIKCGDDFVLPAQEIGTCQISRNCMMSDK